MGIVFGFGSSILLANGAEWLGGIGSGSLEPR